MNTLSTVKPYVIALDLGGTNSVFGIVDSRGEIKATTTIKTRGYATADGYVDAACDALQLIIDQVGGIETVRAMGIGAPNANYYKGTVEMTPNIAWAHDSVVPLADMFSRRLGVPVAITNDANAAAMGEMTYGVARGMKNFIMLTLGTGVGSGIVINGQVVYGHDGFAGELGHMIVKRNNGRLCGCGRTGCLEAYCSATGVARSAREFLEIRTEPSTLRNLPIESITSKDVYDAAMNGDKLAKDVFEYTGTILGEAMADMNVFSSPEAFILFGGLAKSGELLLKPLREAMDRSMLNVFKGKAKVLLSELKDADAAVLGASALGWEAKPMAPVTPAAAPIVAAAPGAPGAPAAPAAPIAE